MSIFCNWIKMDRLPTDLQDAEVLLEELRLHQVELEIQNEELRRFEQALYFIRS